jgi:hypothetical protein
VTNLYLVLFKAILSPSDSKTAPGHGREGYYYGESGEGPWSDVYNAITKALFDLGKVKSPEPAPFTDEEVNANFLVS